MFISNRLAENCLLLFGQVLNVQLGNRSQSEYDSCDAFDSLVKDANFELQKCMY